ncbi:hypothetical protein B0H14DRAFT_3458127 [Mycena olivaceomarginata]|nr:hypothetical protein B0H14DRAFT_3458127 [Mycena olivaceomarginata]
MENIFKAHFNLAWENSKTLIAYESRIKQLEGELQEKVDAEASQAIELGNANTQIVALQAEIATWH